MKSVTQRQEQVLEAIRTYTAEHGYPPTLRDIARAMGIDSTNGVSDHLASLEAKGRISRTPKTARSIVVVGDPEIGPPGSLEHTGGTEAGLALQLLTACLRVTGSTSLARLETVTIIAADLAILHGYLPPSLFRRAMKACGESTSRARSVVPLGADLSFLRLAIRQADHMGILAIDSDTSRVVVGRVLESRTVLPWADGRARLALWALDSIPTLPVIRHAA